MHLTKKYPKVVKRPPFFYVSMGILYQKRLNFSADFKSVGIVAKQITKKVINKKVMGKKSCSSTFMTVY